MTMVTSTITNINQYKEMKSKHPEAILLFRVRDRYEVYDQDALDCQHILGLAISGVKNDIPIAGFPYHALDTNLPQIVRFGRRVAIIEQLEDPKLTKKVEQKSEPLPEKKNPFECVATMFESLAKAIETICLYAEMHSKALEIVKIGNKLSLSPKKLIDELMQVKQGNLFE